MNLREFTLLFGTIACVTVLFLQKENFNAAFSVEFLRFLLWNLQYQCPTWAELQRLTESVFEVQKISFTVLQGTNCLREFRHIMNEISIDDFNFKQILHVLTFRVTSSDSPFNDIFVTKIHFKTIFFCRQTKRFERERKRGLIIY